MDKLIIILVSLGLLSGSAVAGHGDKNLEEIVVEGKIEGFSETQFGPERRISHADAAQLMAQVPGGAANNNGPLTGQLQYRGMFGPRLNVRIDGMLINGGGPNWMAPPLHHIPSGLMEALTVEQGIAAITTGGGIGGAVTAQWKRPAYNDESVWQATGDAELSLGSVDDGTSVALMAGMVNENHRVYLLGSRDEGDDYESGRGTVAATEYERDASGIGYGFRNDKHYLDVDFRKIETGETGTPSLPMDIEFFDSDLWSLRYGIAFDKAQLDVQVYGSDIDHRMNNYRLRMAPDFSSLMLPPFVDDDRRFVNTSSEETGYKIALSLPMASGKLTVGLDGHDAEHEATVFDPDFAMFFVNNFVDTEEEKQGIFLQWDTVYNENWYFEAGLRSETVDMSTAEIDAFPARLVDMNPAAWPMGTPPRAVFMLREAFNAADRNISDDNIDWVLKTRYQASENLIYEIALAQKTRSPIYQERFMWIPLEVNAGLGDGNNYVGNLDLKPEESTQIELGLDWRTETANFSPRIYLREVDDYIQGVPAANPLVVAVSANANGDPTPLMFDNVEATITGLDLDFGFKLNDAFEINGIYSYVRGERDDTDDNLYRIAPQHLRIGLDWHGSDAWDLRVEQVLVDRQDKLSASNTLDVASARNSFAETPGYGLTNLYFVYQVSDGLVLTTGIENVFDKAYTDHLTGFNRVANSIVPIGSRLDGPGRNIFARVRYQW